MTRCVRNKSNATTIAYFISVRVRVSIRVRVRVRVALRRHMTAIWFSACVISGFSGKHSVVSSVTSSRQSVLTSYLLLPLESMACFSVVVTSSL